jgi:hypothetical protein
MYVAGQPCHCIKTAAKPKADADAAIRGFCQDQAANNMRWQTDYCQSQVNTALGSQPHEYQNVAVPLHGLGVMAQPLQQQPPYLAVPRPVRTEVELLREKLAAAEALIEALTPPPAAPVPNPMQRALSRWPGSVGVIQGLRWRA